MLFRPVVMLLILAAAPGLAQQTSNPAAQALLYSEATQACEVSGGAPNVWPEGVIERDFDGDGQLDLLISHEAFVCGERGRSGYCGVQVCTFKIWLRRGEGYQLAMDSMGGGVAVSDGALPEISGWAHGGKGWSMRWNGQGFN